jgi:ketosteroid isomerase-like protein
MLKPFVMLLALLAAACSPATQEKAQSTQPIAHGIESLPVNQPVAPDSAAAAVDAFSAALRAGDQAAVQRLLAPDVVIAESGEAERSFAEYASHHMGADMAFTAAVQFTLERREIIDSGDTATVISQSKVEGAFHGRTIRSLTIETMVLQRASGVWRIVHIHWSSAPIADEHDQ